MESVDKLWYPNNLLHGLLEAVVVDDRHGVEGDDWERDVDGRLHRDKKVLVLLVVADRCN